jgi:ABC-type branched-subunit amino acid transport system ATPase component
VSMVLPASNRLIQGWDLTAQFGSLIALAHVDFELHGGTVTGLVGPNGSGKTTLINGLSGFVPVAGKITLVDGAREHAIDKLSAEKRARLGIGRTFQTPQMFPELSVLECVAMGAVWLQPHRWPRFLQALGLPAARREFRYDLERAEDALEMLSLRSVSDARPRTLPLGQQRMVEVARAICGGNSFLLLDEPLAGLNKGERDQMLSVIERLARQMGLGILLVEHNLEAVKASVDVVWVLNLGSVVACGAPEDVFRSQDVQRIYGGG